MDISQKRLTVSSKGKGNEIPKLKTDSRPTVIEIGSCDSSTPSRNPSFPKPKRKRRDTYRPPTLEARIRDLNLVAVATVLGERNYAMGSDGKPQAGEKEIQNLIEELGERNHLGVAEIVEAFCDVAKQCLHYKCTPTQLAKILGRLSDSAELILTPPDADVDEDAISDHIRVALFLSEVVLEQVAATLPLAFAGGVPNEKLVAKRAMVAAQKSRIDAIKLVNALLGGRVAWLDDAAFTLEAMAEAFTQGDFGRLHSALTMVLTLCEEMGAADIRKDVKDLLREFENQLEKDGIWLAAKLDRDAPKATAQGLYSHQLIEKCKGKHAAKTPSYWKYCCDRLHAEMNEERESKKHDLKCIQSSLSRLKGGSPKPPKSELVTWRTRAVLEIERHVAALMEKKDAASADEIVAALFQLRKKLAKLNSVDLGNRILTGMPGTWLKTLKADGLMPEGRVGKPSSNAAVLIALRMRKELLVRLVEELRLEEEERLKGLRQDIDGRLNILRKRPLEKFRLVMAVRMWEASLAPTTKPHNEDKKNFCLTLLYSFVRDGACTYFGRWAASSVADAVVNFKKTNDSVPDEIFDWGALAVGAGLTAYGLYRMASIRKVSEHHQQSRFGAVLRYSACILPAFQFFAGIGVTTANRVGGGVGMPAVAYELWATANFAYAVTNTSRYLRQMLQTPLMQQTPNIPGLKAHIKNMKVVRLDGQPMPPEHQRILNSIRDGGYSVITTLIGGAAGQLDLQSLVYGLSTAGTAAGEAWDGMWPYLAQLIFVSHFPDEYRLVTVEKAAETFCETLNHFATHAGARSAFGGWVDIWTGVSAATNNRVAAENLNAIRALPFIGGFLLGVTTGPRARLIDDLAKPSFMASPSGLGTSIVHLMLSCIPPLQKKYDAHVDGKIQDRFHLMDTTIGRAAYQTAEQFRGWVDALAKQIGPDVASKKVDFDKVLQHHWKENANPLAHVTDAGEIKMLLEAWWREAKSEDANAPQCHTIRTLLRTTTASLTIAGSQPLVMQPIV